MSCLECLTGGCLSVGVLMMASFAVALLLFASYGLMVFILLMLKLSRLKTGGS
jgi:hypothetical protein